MNKLLILSAIFLVGCFFGYNVGKKKAYVTEATVDTIIFHDTIKPKPKIIKDWYSHTDTDTVYSVDSIPIMAQIPITTKIYSDSSYRAVVSGYKATLDSISIFRKTTTIENKIYYPKLYKPKLTIGITGGYGASNTGLTPYIGVGITYNLFSW